MDSGQIGHKEDVAVASDSIELTPAPAFERPELSTEQFTRLYEEYFSFVWRTVRRLGVADRFVDDAVQDTFLVIHRRLGDFEGRSTIKSWVFGIARRVAKDHRRRAQRKDRGESLPESLSDPQSPNPRESAAKAQALAVLYAILDGMDDDKREVFILAELEQMSIPQIAEAINVNVNTIYSRLRAARRVFEQGVQRHQARDRRAL